MATNLCYNQKVVDSFGYKKFNFYAYGEIFNNFTNQAPPRITHVNLTFALVGWVNIFSPQNKKLGHPRCKIS